jgi:hypothetical protein
VHSLDGAWAKIARANEHFDTLKTEVGSPSDHTDSITFAQKFDPDASTIEVTLQGVPQLPFRWALIAADALQNLRAALNYLTWELARWHLASTSENREPSNRTQFPIHTKPRAFDSSMVADLHPDHAAIIKSLQPNEARYLSQFSETDLLNLNVETFAARSPLGTLARLTNTDKHKVLQPALINMSVVEVGHYELFDCTLTHSNFFARLVLENGAQWVRLDVTPTGPEPKVKVNDKFTPEISFGGWDMRGPQWLVNCVTEIVGSSDWPF